MTREGKFNVTVVCFECDRDWYDRDLVSRIDLLPSHVEEWMYDHECKEGEDDGDYWE